MNLLKEHHLAFFCFSLGIIVIGWFFLFSGCAVVPAQPNVDLSTWAGDSITSSIRRGQENRKISCGDPDFNKYVCMEYSDLQKIFNAIAECQ